MPVTFKVEPRHVKMFGAQGTLAPLYQRQATQLALTEKQREEQAQFEQMKALTELRARLQQQLQGPLQEAQIGAAGARQDVSELQLGKAEDLEKLIGQYGAATTEEERGSALREIGIRQGWYRPGQGQQQQQFAPQRPTFIGDPETGLPLVDEQGNRISVPGTMKFPPTGAGGLQVGRLNLAERVLKGFRAKYDPKTRDKAIRRDYSGIEWDSSAMKALGLERAGIFGVQGYDDAMDSFMQAMFTPATVIDQKTGKVIPDEAEYARRVDIISRFREGIELEPEGKSKNKMREILHNMERAMDETYRLSSEGAQIMLSQPTSTPTPPDTTGGIHTTWTP